MSFNLSTITRLQQLTECKKKKITTSYKYLQKKAFGGEEINYGFKNDNIIFRLIDKWAIKR